MKNINATCLNILGELNKKVKRNTLNKINSLPFFKKLGYDFKEAYRLMSHMGQRGWIIQSETQISITDTGINAIEDFD